MKLQLQNWPICTILTIFLIEKFQSDTQIVNLSIWNGSTLQQLTSNYLPHSLDFRNGTFEDFNFWPKIHYFAQTLKNASNSIIIWCGQCCNFTTALLSEGELGHHAVAKMMKLPTIPVLWMLFTFRTTLNSESLGKKKTWPFMFFMNY